jgi:hypothetical protein
MIDDGRFTLALFRCGDFAMLALIPKTMPDA